MNKTVVEKMYEIEVELNKQYIGSSYENIRTMLASKNISHMKVYKYQENAYFEENRINILVDENEIIKQVYVG